MERSIAALTLALISSSLLSAQERPQTPSDTIAVRSAAKSLTVSGRLNPDGRTLVTDIDAEWSITNPQMLKGREGSLVTIKCFVDVDRNQLRVLSVKRASELKNESRLGDSAFRR